MPGVLVEHDLDRDGEVPLYAQMLKTGFAHRSTMRGNQEVAYALADGSREVLVPRGDWIRLGTEYAERTRRVRQIALLTVFGSPFVILFFAIFLADYLPHPIALALLLAGFGWWVGSWLVWYPLQVRRITHDVERCLRSYPATYRSQRDPRRQPRVLQLLFLLLVGPHLLISAYGELAGPDAFRNTPWVGRGFGTAEWIGLAIFVAFFAWPRLVRRR
ncbi:hypothetical protein J4558_10720 [Leptolyngbya sp. 15MV]|nr:hypothetical protein J4558_10720 [Leptolyngbya sp. 15MV]